MAPTGEAYNVDWVVSNTSNAHVCTHRDWLTAFTPFASKCSYLYSETEGLADVIGIGTVELTVRLHAKYRAHRPTFHTIILTNVLLVPGYASNVFAQPVSGFQMQLRVDGGMLLDKDGKCAGLIESPVLPRLRLQGQTAGCTSLEKGECYAINAYWPVAYRAKWEAFQKQARQKVEKPVEKPARQQHSKQQDEKQPAKKVTAASSETEEAPYTADEKAWLKKNYDGEFKFLRDLGLSMFKEEDREEGRGIARSLMEEDDADFKPEPKTKTKAKAKVQSKEDDEDSEEENSDDDANSFLEEIEKDPMSHMADFNFSAAELKWIKKHYQYSSNFMLSYGLKPYEDDDCEEAKSIIKAMMTDD
jgi:hypothetical protein